MKVMQLKVKDVLGFWKELYVKDYHIKDLGFNGWMLIYESPNGILNAERILEWEQGKIYTLTEVDNTD